MDNNDNNKDNTNKEKKKTKKKTKKKKKKSTNAVQTKTDPKAFPHRLRISLLLALAHLPLNRSVDPWCR